MCRTGGEIIECATDEAHVIRCNEFGTYNYMEQKMGALCDIIGDYIGDKIATMMDKHGVGKFYTIYF